MTRRRAFLAYAMGASLGLLVAVVAGSWTVGWGAALMPMVATVIFSVGLHRERTEPFRHVLRFLIAFTAALLVLLVPTVLLDLVEPVSWARDAAQRARTAALVRPLFWESVVRWAVMASAVPVAAWRLWSERARISR